MSQLNHVVDYYAYGKTLREFIGTTKEKYGCQGSEQNPEIADNDYYTLFRGLDVEIARLKQIDPKPNHSQGSYMAMGANPVSYTDIKGDTIFLDKNGYITRNDKKDNLVYATINGKPTSLGELGKTVRIDEIYKNLLATNSKTADGMWNPWKFKNLVKSGGEWDLKSNQKTIYGLANTMANDGKIAQTKFTFDKKTMEAQDIGNHHYGVVGKAFGFGEKILLQKAGEAQISGGTSKAEWQNYHSYTVKTGDGVQYRREMLPPYGDNPRDQEWIKAGFLYYNENSKNLDND